MNDLINLVKEGNCENLREVFSDRSARSLLDECYWDLIPELCELFSENDENVSFCIEYCLLIIVEEVSSPKDLLIVLMEQFDKFISDFRFRTLLRPISKCIDYLPSKKGFSLGMVLNILYAHIKSMTLSENTCDLNRIYDRIDMALEFIHPFARQISLVDPSKSNYRKNNEKQVDEILLFIIKVLSYPLLLMDYVSSNEILKTIYLKLGRILDCCTIDVLVTISLLEEENRCITYKKDELISLRSNSDETENIEKVDTDLLDVDEELPEMGICMIPFLMTIEEYRLPIPSLYKADTTTGFLLSVSLNLLKDDREVVIKKGISIAIQLFSSLHEEAISFIKLQRITNTLDAIYNILLKVPNIDVRRYASKVLPLLLKALSDEGKYVYFMKTITHNHQAVKGYSIILLKNTLQEILNFNKESKFFRGKYLGRLIDYIYKFNVEQDILDNSEFLLDALSFLRYLLSVDKRYETYIKEKTNDIEKNFLKPLKSSIDLAKAHYELDIKNQGNNEEDKQKTEFLKAAVVRIEMIESVLAICSDLKSRI